MRKSFAIVLAAVLCAVAQAAPQYTPLAYVEAANGNVYVNTGINPTSTTRVWTDFQMLSADKNVRLFGVERNNVSYSFAIQNANTKYWIYTAQDGNESNTSSGKAADTNRHTVDFNNNRAISIDGGHTYSAAISSTFTKTASAPLYIGASRYNSNPSYYSKHRIYAFKVWEGGKLVRDLFPVAVGSATGLMDRVSWNFYTSKGTSVYTGSVGADIVTFSSDRREAYEYSLGVSYDTVDNLVDGETYSWTAPSAAQTIATDTTATCIGHRLYSVDPATGAMTLAHDGAGETTVSFTHAAGVVWHVEWLWNFGFATYYVSKVGSDSNDGKSWETAFATPKKALFVAPNHATIRIGEGTWYNTGNCDMVVSNAVTIIGAGRDRTFFDGNAAAVVASGYLYDKGGTSTSTWRWIMEVRNAGAVVSGLTMQGGFRYNPNNQTSASGLQLYNGTVSNCVVRLCRGGNSGPANSGAGVYIAAGLLKDCEIYGNVGRYNNNTSCYGGGVIIYGGTVDSCVITNNSAGTAGAGVYIRGGTLKNSVIADNHGHYSNATTGNYMGTGGAGVYMGDAGSVVENCVITNNTRYTKQGAGVYMNHASAVLRNCLVAGNTAQTYAGGVLLANGRVENCTIAGNSSLNNGGDGSGLRQTGGTALNNIIYGNATSAGASDTYVSGGTFKTNIVTLAPFTFSSGDGNLAADPLFASPGTGNYMLRFGSPAIDAANPNAAIKTDVAGTVRPQGVANDIGCYEYVSSGSLVCVFNSTAATYLDTASPTFTATIADAAGPVSYAWYLDGVLQPSLTGASATFANLGYGRHTVRLVVSDGVSTAEFSAPDVVSVTTSSAYVSMTGSDTYPYETQEKAARKIQDAIDAVWATDEAPGTVTVGPGTYYPDDASYFLTRPIRVISSNGPATTIVNARNPKITNCRRAFLINSGKALVSGFTMIGGSWYNPTLGHGPGSVWLYNGTVSNCVFRGNHGDSTGGAVRIENGLLTHCVITNNTSYYSGNTGVYGQGGGVYMTGGEVAWCEIRNNKGEARDSGAGCGVWMSNGYLHDCVIADNSMRQPNNDNRRGQGLYMSNGTVERCVITNNFSSSYIQANAGGVAIAGGTLRNCLVADNKVKTNGGGIFQTGGTVEFCTVTANTSVDAVNSGLFLNGSSAVFRYNVLDGNGAGVSSEPNCNVAYTAAASFATNIVVTPVGTTYGTDNIYEAAGFESAQFRDWTLGSGSKAIDAVASADWVADDLNGNARPEDGDGEGGAAWDLGCYEAPDAGAGALRCSFSPDSVTGLDSLTVVFTASANGAGSEGTLTYAWDFGEGATATAVGGDPAVQSVTYSTPGARTVSLAVEAAGGQSATYTVADCVKVGAASIFVDASSTNSVWPYATWETAAKNVQDVFDSLITDGTTPISILVTNGTYTLTAPYTVLTYPLHLKSVEGPGKTTIRAASASDNARSHFRLTHAGVVVSGFTLSNAKIDPWNTSDRGASSLRISAGVVSNCVITGAETCRSDYGAVHVSGTGLLTHSVIRNSNCNKSTSSGAVQHGGGLTISGTGVAEYCVVSNCYAEGATGSHGGGVYVTGGVLRDSSVFNCATAASSDSGGAIYQTGGLVERCVIGDSTTRKAGGAAIYQTSGTMRNCLVEGFVAKSNTQALNLTGGSFVNNTVVTNGFGTAAASPIAATVAGGSVSNCVFAVNNGGDIAQTGGTVAYSCYAEADNANGNISAAPMLMLPEEAREGKPAWSLKSGSPCINKGSYFALGATKDAVRQQIDLIGRPRFVSFGVDMGCFESAGGAGTMIFLK